MKPPTALLATLEKALESRGFVRDPGIVRARWRGQVDGRSCHVELSVQGRTRYSGEVRTRDHLGYRLRIDLSTPLHTRLFLVRSAIARNRLVRWIYRLRKQHTIAEVPAALQGFDVVAVDRDFALRLIHQPRVASAIGELLTRDATAKLAGSVHFGPGTIYYSSPILQADAITPERVAEVTENLLSTLTTAEVLPKPEITSVPTRLEALSKRQPLLVAGLILIGGLGALMIVAGLLIALFFLLLSMAR